MSPRRLSSLQRSIRPIVLVDENDVWPSTFNDLCVANCVLPPFNVTPNTLLTYLIYSALTVRHFDLVVVAIVIVVVI